MISLVFPGQGSQKVGMGSDLYNKFESTKELFKRLINDTNNKRPYFEESKNKKNLKSLWDEREKYYIKCADYIIKTDTKNPFEIANEIIENLK